MNRTPIWAVWDDENGLEVLQKEKWERRRDLSAVIFRLATDHDPPYSSTSKVKRNMLPKGYIWVENLELIELGMFYGEIWNSLQCLTNFSYWMVFAMGTVSQLLHFYFKIPSVDSQWGFKNPDGSWNGMVSSIKE